MDGSYVSLSDNENYSLFLFVLLYKFLCMDGSCVSLSDNENWSLFLFVLLYEFLCMDGNYVSLSDFENYFLFLFVVWISVCGWQLCVPVRLWKLHFIFVLLYEFLCVDGIFFSLPVRQQKLCLIFSVLLYEFMCVDGSVCFFLPVRQKLFLFVLLYEFFCLGGSYVSLSDNEKTGYKARELKSVHVDALGTFLRLNIHKNHINKHNLYNQVTCGVCVCVCVCVCWWGREQDVC